MATQNKFFAFMRERHAIYLRRKSGGQWPWTQDKILQTYKFTNVYRELDAVTLWMRENITEPNRGCDPNLMLFNCALFRFIGSPAPFDAGVLPKWTTSFDGKVRARYAAAMRKAIRKGNQVFTGAYIIPNMGLTDDKQDVVLDYILAPLWRALAAPVFCETKTMREVFDWLHDFKGLGGNGFMAYEIVTDLRWTSFYAKPPEDRFTWANAGPGARRGLNRIHGRDKDFNLKSSTATQEMYELRLQSTLYWPNDKNYPPLEMREIEHSLCEYDKYERVRLGEGRPRSVYRPPAQR